MSTLIILGATGDLTRRLLLPGLATLLATERARGLAVVGSGRADWDDERWRSTVAQAFASAGVADDVAAEVAGRANYRRADATSADDLRNLLASLEGPIAIYFALTPQVTFQACCALRETGVPKARA